MGVVGQPAGQYLSGLGQGYVSVNHLESLLSICEAITKDIQIDRGMRSSRKRRGHFYSA
jgi:hypothetical protein